LLLSHAFHQCSKGFLPRLFSTFCLGSGTEAYWGEAKRYTFWPRLSPEVIDPVLCLGCFETGAIYIAFCLGSVRTEAIRDKYFFFNSNFRRPPCQTEPHALEPAAPSTNCFKSNPACLITLHSNQNTNSRRVEQPKIFFTNSNKPSSALAATLQTPSSATTTTTVCHSPGTSAKPASDTGPEVELSETFPLVVAAEKTSVSNVQTVTLLLTLLLLPPIQTLPHCPTSLLLQPQTMSM